MNIFTKILADEYANDTRLGIPSKDGASALRRAQAMYQMTGGKGFMVYPKGPKVSRGGQTRKELEAPAKAVFEHNLFAEVSFRERAASEGWGISKINRAIEQRLHMKEIQS